MRAATSVTIPTPAPATNVLIATVPKVACAFSAETMSAQFPRAAVLLVGQGMFFGTLALSLAASLPFIA